MALPINPYMLRRGMEAGLLFIVAPINKLSDMGFWVQAADADEARLLVSLNVPGMESAENQLFARCEPDERYSPGHGAITGGNGRTYTITRRRPKNTTGPEGQESPPT